MKPELNQRYSMNDWAQWTGQWELIDGKAYNMTPAPSSNHQYCVTRLSAQLLHFYLPRGCEVFVAPFDVYFSESDDYAHPEHVVQPDIVVICNRKRIDKKGCFGAPNLVIEVISPSTAIKDYNTKYQLYERFGVEEYWIIDPVGRAVTKLSLHEGQYTDPVIIEADGFLEHGGLNIPLASILSNY
ncbi:Uma2 family endonuclease [Paenibacillus caseinilyticus]|uniref:Uma2 family endonuclease n=1 Tax=Paenibacillus mucilaginosus K02 TaxID=997761 RepID=I0BD73_9BACL|nr:Uma2 family endonuclease [Paenibacillus mucilaginosus]AFH60320.1 Uma2 family endonuclease [Paenibacillus mucilaginosus K02]